MSLREEFVALAAAEGANVRELCRCFWISPTTGYTWLGRPPAPAARLAGTDAGGGRGGGRRTAGPAPGLGAA